MKLVICWGGVGNDWKWNDRWVIDIIVGEKKGWIFEKNVKMEKLLLFGMIHMDCLMEEDKESRYIYKWVRIGETSEWLKVWLFLWLSWNIGGIYIN